MSEEITKLQKIKDNCKFCGGIGVSADLSESGDLVINKCRCIKRIEKEIDLIRANIPPMYREFNLRKLTRAFKNKNEAAIEALKDYADNIEENIEKGRGLWMYSNPGLGKSSLISWVLKRALEKDHAAYFSRASHLVTKKLEALKQDDSKSLINYIVDKVDILALEEIEKVYLTSHEDFIPNLFFEFLSDLYDAKKAILISSNVDIAEALFKFPIYIQDRLKDVKVIKFVGKSERGKSEWE